MYANFTERYKKHKTINNFNEIPASTSITANYEGIHLVLKYCRGKLSDITAVDEKYKISNHTHNVLLGKVPTSRKEFATIDIVNVLCVIVVEYNKFKENSGLRTEQIFNEVGGRLKQRYFHVIPLQNDFNGTESLNLSITEYREEQFPSVEVKTYSSKPDMISVLISGFISGDTFYMIKSGLDECTAPITNQKSTIKKKKKNSNLKKEKVSKKQPTLETTNE